MTAAEMVGLLRYIGRHLSASMLQIYMDDPPDEQKCGRTGGWVHECTYFMGISHCLTVDSVRLSVGYGGVLTVTPALFELRSIKVGSSAVYWNGSNTWVKEHVRTFPKVLPTPVEFKTFMNLGSDHGLVASKRPVVRKKRGQKSGISVSSKLRQSRAAQKASMLLPQSGPQQSWRSK